MKLVVGGGRGKHLFCLPSTIKKAKLWAEEEILGQESNISYHNEDSDDHYNKEGNDRPFSIPNSLLSLLETN